MSGDVKVIQPVDPSASPTTITTVGGSVGTVQELFIPREDFSANPSYQVTTCESPLATRHLNTPNST